MPGYMRLTTRRDPAPVPDRCIAPPAQQRGMPEADARWLFQQLLVAVEYCHLLGIANRDVKVRLRCLPCCFFRPLTCCALWLFRHPCVLPVALAPYAVDRQHVPRSCSVLQIATRPAFAFGCLSTALSMLHPCSPEKYAVSSEVN